MGTILGGGGEKLVSRQCGQGTLEEGIGCLWSPSFFCDLTFLPKKRGLFCFQVPLDEALY